MTKHAAATAAALRQIAPIVDGALFDGLAAIAAHEGMATRLREFANRAAARNDHRGVARREREISEELAEANEIREEIEPLRAIAEAGNWARFFFVPGGHVHRRHCSTLRATTERMMITEYAAASDEEIVKAAGSRACTVCFADAPIDPSRRSIIRFAVEEEEAREAEAAEKAAKRSAAADAAIRNADGSVAFKTRRAAENALGREIDDLVYFSSYSKGYNNQATGEFIPNPETPEQHWAEREERLIAPARRAVRAAIDLLKDNGIPAEEVDALAAKKLAAKVKASTKCGLILPEGFGL